MAKYDPVSYKRPNDAGKTLGRLLGCMAGYRVRVYISALAALANGAIGVLGTYSYKIIINEFILKKDPEGLVRGVAILASVYLCGALASLIYSQFMAKAAQGTVYFIRGELFRKMQTLPLGFFDRNSIGDLMSRFTNDLDTISEGLSTSFPSLFQSISGLISTVIMLTAINFRLALIVLTFEALTFVYIRFATGKSRFFYRAQQGYLGKLNGFLEEIISGQKVVKVFNREKQVFDQFDSCNENLRDAAEKGAAYTGAMVPTVVGIAYLNYALTAIGGGLLCIHGKLDLGSITAFLVCVRQASMPINQLTKQTTFILSALASAERIFSLLDEKPETDEGTVIETAGTSGEPLWHDTDPQAGSEDIPLRGDIRFSDITFGYNDKKTVLHDVSLHAGAGSKAAFVGATGAGKTTIMNLVLRFYEISQGSILFDGIDIRRIKKHDLRKNIAIIVQTTHLFSGTIADNIRYGRIDASDEEVAEAAKLAHADSFIRRFPDGYQTLLHNDGDNLSQGQRQLLAIARAAIAKPRVLVLDEATSSVDTRTERLIESGFDSLMEGRTVLVIAHRLSTVRNSDEIMVIEKGRILERGSHAELIASDGFYSKLYSGQFELE